jgi:general secretion pathway protein D
MERRVTRRILKVVSIVTLAAVAAGCSAGMAFRRGEAAARLSDWDAAVVHYREAVQADPDKPEYKIALERSMLNASRVHLVAARDAEEKGDLEVAVREYRRASEYDPTNRLAAAKVAELDQVIRERIEASRPKPAVQQMRERARQLAQEPVLNPASREPLNIRFTNASVRDILNFIGSVSGINITFASDYRDPAGYTVQIDGVTLEEALQQILSANQLFYKVLNERTILIIPDNAQNRAKYEEQVVRIFYLSHADATEVAQLLNTVLRVPGVAVIPTIAPNKTSNTITIRATAAMAAIMERVIDANDRPRAEVVLDVSIMEVNRQRMKQYGLDLSQYSITGIFSPEVAPTFSTPTGGSPTLNVQPFNANTISTGISAADFYLIVPQAIARFLESDTRTKLIAKPQLRGQEGQKITLNLGDDIPVPQTTFGSFGGAGSLATQPISSFNYRAVGVNVIMTPRVTFDNDIVLELTVESSTLGADVNIAGQNLPSFGSRKVETKIRLRDGESTLLAGLLREDERRALKGVIGLIHVPGLRSLFASNDNTLTQTDIVMLLTPHVVRTHQLRQQDVNPIYIGTQQNLGLGGPPPLIAPPQGTPPGGAAAPAEPGAAPVPPGAAPGTVPGTLPAPGVVPFPQQPPTQQPPTQPPPAQPAPATPPAETPPPPETPAPAPPAAAQPPAERSTAAAGGVAQVVVTAPGTEFSVGGGPYTVPISITSDARVTTMSLTVTYSPSQLRVRSVQEGSFMRQGGADASFSHQVDAGSGRIDVTITRAQDPVGASGTGLLAAVLFDAVAPGAATLSVSGTGTGPAGGVVPVQATPVTITVR